MGLREEVKILLNLEGVATVDAGLDRVAAKFSKTNAQVAHELKGIASIGSVIGRTVAPELEGLAHMSISLVGELKHAASAVGLSIGSVVGVIAALAIPIGLTANAWSDYAKAAEEATKATEAWKEQRTKVREEVEAEARALKELGLLNDAAIERITGPHGGKSFAEDPAAGARQLREIKNLLGLNDDPVSKFRRSLSDSMTDGPEKERVAVEAAFAARQEELKTLVKKQQLSGEIVQQLQDEVNLEHEIGLARLDDKATLDAMKVGRDYAAKVAKEEAEAAAEEEKAMRGIIEKAKEIADQRVRARDLAAGLAAENLRTRAGAESNDPAERAEALRLLADMELAQNRAKIEAEILDEQLRNQALEDARQIHAERMTNIAQQQANAEQRIREQRLDAGVTFLRNLQNAAKLFGKQGFALFQTAAIAEATVATYMGATKAYASLAGIPYVGPVLGAIAAGAAIASGVANIATIANTSPGYAEGGYTGDISPHATAGVVHGREFVFSAPATAAIGRGNLEAMHDAASSGAGAMPAQRVVVIDDRRQVRDLANDPEFETVIVDLAQRNQWRIA